MAIDRVKVETVVAALLESAYSRLTARLPRLRTSMHIAAVDYDQGERTSLHFEVNGGISEHVGTGLLI